MKWFCALLLAANLIFWGYPTQPAESPRLGAEINADKVKLITSLPLITVQRPASNASSVASAIAPQATPAPAPITPTPKVEAVAVCIRWSGIGQEQINTMRTRLNALGLTATETGVSGKVWVYIPPQTDMELANRKAQQLSDQGVQDYYVINNGGRWQNAISLGIFSSREGADRRLNELKNQGVKSAVIRERDDSPTHATFDLRRVSRDQQGKLEKINSQLKGAQLQVSSCS
jgi:hypothetical protein